MGQQAGAEKFYFQASQNNGVLAAESTCFEDGMWDSFGGYHTTRLNILKALCSVPILNNVPTSALKSC